MQDRDEHISQMLVAMAENFGAELSPALAGMILEALEPYDLDQITAGLNHVMRTRKYKSMPTLAEILEAVEGGSQEDRIQAQADQQWRKLLYLSAYESPAAHLDPVACEAYRAMGANKHTWREDDVHFRRKEFLELYARLAKREQALQIEAAPQVRLLASQVGRDVA